MEKYEEVSHKIAALLLLVLLHNMTDLLWKVTETWGRSLHVDAKLCHKQVRQLPNLTTVPTTIVMS